MGYVDATLHMVGAVMWSAYAFQQWQFSQIWALWAVFRYLCMDLVCYPWLYK